MFFSAWWSFLSPMHNVNDENCWDFNMAFRSFRRPSNRVFVCRCTPSNMGYRLESSKHVALICVRLTAFKAGKIFWKFPMHRTGIRPKHIAGWMRSQRFQSTVFRLWRRFVKLSFPVIRAVVLRTSASCKFGWVLLVLFECTQTGLRMQRVPCGNY